MLNTEYTCIYYLLNMDIINIQINKKIWLEISSPSEHFYMSQNLAKPNGFEDIYMKLLVKFVALERKQLSCPSILTQEDFGRTHH